LPRSNVCSTRDLENPSASVHLKRFSTPSLTLKFLCAGKLNPRGSYGYAILDNIPVKQPLVYLKEKFQTGLTFPDSPPIRLDRSLEFSQASDGTCHLCSLADIMLGSFRYCVNEPNNEEAGKAMFPALLSMMWNRERNGKKDVSDCGLVLRPTNVEEAKHKAEYDALTQRLQGYLDAE
jgi:hypothetical protein